jgi:hypothetical protein
VMGINTLFIYIISLTWLLMLVDRLCDYTTQKESNIDYMTVKQAKYLLLVKKLL